MCRWKFDIYHDYYETGCGHTFTFIDGSSQENGFKYCPYCGGKIDASLKEKQKC